MKRSWLRANQAEYFPCCKVTWPVARPAVSEPGGSGAEASNALARSWSVSAVVRIVFHSVTSCCKANEGFNFATERDYIALVRVLQNWFGKLLVAVRYVLILYC